METWPIFTIFFPYLHCCVSELVAIYPITVELPFCICLAPLKGLVGHLMTCTVVSTLLYGTLPVTFCSDAFLQHRHTELSGERVGEPEGQHLAAGDVQDRHQVQEMFCGTSLLVCCGEKYVFSVPYSAERPYGVAYFGLTNVFAALCSAFRRQSRCT
jgi:hypothetical protein